MFWKNSTIKALKLGALNGDCLLIAQVGAVVLILFLSVYQQIMFIDAVHHFLVKKIVICSNALMIANTCAAMAIYFNSSVLEQNCLVLWGAEGLVTLIVKTKDAI